MFTNVEPPRSNRWLPEVNKIPTRGPVSSHNKQLVLKYLNNAREDMARYELEISKHKAAILMLEARQTGLKKTMKKHSSLLAPIRKLSPDVLLEILSYLCDESSIDD
ncbi:hypothetical protein PM082_021135 [Marasmius tenuissimus]|nr:hypothetical protein PM082_021135 [Marasmius tenuissimus]